MKPLEIISALKQFSSATSDEIIGSPAFALACRIGDEPATLRRAEIEPDKSQMLCLAVTFGGEPHILSIARSPRFAELDRIWDSRAEIPDAIVLALVERECGPLLQMLENAVRRELQLTGLSNTEQSGGDAFQVGDMTFVLTRSATVASAFGVLRNLDLSHESIRSVRLHSVTEYAAFALSDSDLNSIVPGDALLLPEAGSIPPRFIVDGRFAVDPVGVSVYKEDGACRIRAAEECEILLGEIIDASTSQESALSAGAERTPSVNSQLRLVRGGRTIATGRFGALGDHPAFIVETKE